MSKMKYTVTPFDGVAELWELEMWGTEKPFLAVTLKEGRVRNWNQYKTFDGAKNQLAKWGIEIGKTSETSGYRGAIVMGKVE